MKVIFKLFLVFLAVVFAGLALIKFIQGCSWKEAVGLAEELFKEI